MPITLQTLKLNTEHKGQSLDPWSIGQGCHCQTVASSLYLPTPGTHALPLSASPELTYDLHAGQVDSDFLESGEASSGVILPAVAIISAAPVIGTFCWVVQPKQRR